MDGFWILKSEKKKKNLRLRDIVTEWYQTLPVE